VVDERIPAVRLGAGYPRAYEMLMTMQGNGYKVSFMPSIIQDRIQPETDHLLSLGIQIVDNVDELIPSNMFDVLLISRPIVFAKEYQLLTSKFPEAWLVYDAEALFYIREQKRREVLQIGSSSDELEEQKQIEMSLIEKADQVISVSERERELMLQNSTQKNISIYAYYPPKKSGGLPFEEREGVLLVGSFFAGPGCPNEDAALWFVKEVWPEVQKEIGCKLYIVGSEPTDSVKALGDNDNVVVTGYVEDIGYYYNHCRVNVVPTRFSAGVPLKVIEALTYDIPTIASPIVIKQMVQNVGELVGANSNNQWIYHIIRSYTEPDFWRTINDKDVNG
jgi:glycosyltransferase involved in cell wall biosynthesis